MIPDRSDPTRPDELEFAHTPSRHSPDAIPGVRDHVYRKLKVTYGNESRVFTLLLPAPGR